MFSLPIIRAVDALVGATNSMMVEASNESGNRVTFRVTHPDLEEAVGLGTAAFAMELLSNDVSPGVHFPPELPADVRARILQRVRLRSSVWDLDLTSAARVAGA